MTTYTIERKPSNSGTIYDLASDMYDRDIRFRAGTKYAVVLPAYYGDSYTTHRTAESAIRQKTLCKYQGPVIIDADGTTYVEHDGRLCRS